SFTAAGWIFTHAKPGWAEKDGLDDRQSLTTDPESSESSASIKPRDFPLALETQQLIELLEAKFTVNLNSRIGEQRRSRTDRSLHAWTEGTVPKGNHI
ncbi:MAG: hypothetical protein ACK48X_12515, partial [Planctomycetota bacterium]